MEKIVEYLRKLNHPVTLEELKAFLNVKSGEELKELIKDLNNLIDKREIIEIDGQYEMMLSDKRKIAEIVIKRNRHAYIYDGDDALEVLNMNKFTLLNKDEVLYERLNNHQALIISVLKHHIVYVVGLIRIFDRKIHFFPDDDNFPRSFKLVNDQHLKLNDKTKVRCFVSNYEKKELKVERIIGRLYDPSVQALSILYTYDIDMEFTNTALNEAKTFSEDIKVSDFPNRHDLSEQLVITIDGDDAKDFDDAISVSKKGDNYLLYVHIADVSHYVRVKSSLDKQAYKRGTSIYYPGSVIPMLPFELSNGVCSLKPNENRLALTVEMEIDKQGQIVHYDFYESVIRSKYRMTYSDVNKILMGDEVLKEKYAKILDMIDDAYALSNILKAKRKLKGGIEFESDESYFEFENGQVVNVYPRVSGISEGIIEDFMIEANVCVADHMRYLEYPMIYRNHDNPKEEKLEAFINFVEKLGYHFKGNKKAIHARQLADCLESFKDELQYPVVSNYCLRSMAKAKYENESKGHFGLGLDNYCHFTSPIRRYPDLIVHRMLKKYVLNSPDFSELEKDSEQNIKIANNCSNKEKMATEIERDIDDLFKCQYMQKHVGEIFEGVISSITSFGFYVKLENTVEGLVHIKTLDNYYELKDDGSLSDGFKSYRLGDIVKVKCREVDCLRGNIDFVLYRKRHVQKWI